MLATTLAVAVATPNVEAQVTTTPKPAKSGHVQANGIDYYYEIHGSGEPLLLLHGGLGSIDMFASNVLPALAKTRQVIAVDLQGHGRTTLGDRPINLIDIANDLGVVLDKLGLKQVDVVGYSFGGGAGLRLAIQHPNVVRRLTVISAPYAQNGFFRRCCRSRRRWVRRWPSR
jgi:pimeloyl-ACP methyl ester carboxylesterase